MTESFPGAQIMVQAQEGVRQNCIKAMSDAGFCLFPLISFPSDDCKKPAIKAWQNLGPGAYTLSNLPNNYGVALKAGDLVIDIDPRNGGTESFAKLARDLALDTTDTFSVQTGSGGIHIYLSKPADSKIRKHLKDYPGIDFLSTGAYVVGPGSRHPNGNLYNAVTSTPDSIRNAPVELLNILLKEDIDQSDVEEVKTDDAGLQSRFKQYLSEPAPVAVSGQNGDDTTFKVCCEGRDLGINSAVVYKLMLEHWNPRCMPPWSPTSLKDKVANAYRYAAGKQGARHPGQDFKDVSIPSMEALTEEQANKARTVNWRTNQKDGKTLKTLHNLLNYLRHPGAGLDRLFGLNEFTGQIEVTRPAPWHNGQLPRHPGIVDHDLKLLKAHLSKEYDFEVSVTIIEEGVTAISYENKFHPVREYLKGLKWDGVARLDTWLSDYAGVDNNPYTRACARKTLCAAVARVFHPGCKFDHILVLEGDQDTGKSRLCAALGGDFYGDFIIDPHNKDTIQNLQGKWIIEMSEMEVTRRSDVSALKAFITRTTDKARLAYLRLSAEFPRQCVFIGTINPEADGAWLKDDTGNRRFWPVAQHGIIDVAGLKSVRDQLFAEAVSIMVSKGKKEPLYMESKLLKDMAKGEAAQRHAEHPWTDSISIWLNGQPATRNFVTAREIFLEAMAGTDQKLDRKVTVPIAMVMKTLGWVKTVKNLGTAGRGSVRGYSRPKVDEALEAAKGDLGDLV